MQCSEADAGFEMLLDVGQGGEFVEGGHHVLVAVEAALATAGIEADTRKEARAVEVDIRTEHIEGKGVDRGSERPGMWV